MFENLQEKLQRTFKNLRGQGKLSEENIGEALREIRLALLEADVNFKVVKELIDHIREKALGQEVMTALSPAEQVVKIVRDELVELLGRDTARLKFASQPPTVVLVVDTAGRLHIDEQLMDEMQSLKRLLSPQEILFVADSMTGQDAVKSAEEFHKKLALTGVVLTKMDGDARGGAALSIRHVTG